MTAELRLELEPDPPGAVCGRPMPAPRLLPCLVAPLALLGSLTACQRPSDAVPDATASARAAPTPALAPSATPTLSAATPASSAGSTARTSGDLCVDICELTKPLRCSAQSQCVPDCHEMRSGEHCRAQMDAFVACLVRHPVDRWECVEDGTASIKEGFCDPEQEAYILCVASALR